MDENKLLDEIKELVSAEHYFKAISAITDSHSTSAVLQSYLAYCHFHTLNYKEAIEIYDRLAKQNPTETKYQFNLGQCYYKISKYDQCIKCIEGIEDWDKNQKYVELSCASHYAKGDTKQCQEMLKKIPKTVNNIINDAVILFKDGKAEKALLKYEEAIALYKGPFYPELYYNYSLAFHQIGQNKNATKYLDRIIKNGVKELETTIDTSDTSEESSSRKIQSFSKYCLTESINLKAAIEYEEGFPEKAKTTIKRLTDLYNQYKVKVDSVTYHNEAILLSNENFSESIKRLTEIIRSKPFPSEAYQNLLHLYCKYHLYKCAEDLLNERPDYSFKYLHEDDKDYALALINEPVNPQFSLKIYDRMAERVSTQLRHIKELKAKVKDDDGSDRLKKEERKVEDMLVTVISSKAKIYWGQKDYKKAEQIMRTFQTQCKSNEVYLQNLAHTLFMQEDQHEEAIKYYEMILEKNNSNLNKVDTFVLANLCVCYILTHQEEKADQLVRQIKGHESLAILNSTPIFHYCSVSLVIGTLYCSQQCFEVGLKKIIESLEPLDQTLGTDTWHYVKRCFLAFIEQYIKKAIQISDKKFWDLIFSFLEEVQKYGKGITTVLYQHKDTNNEGSTVASEAAYLFKVLKKVTGGEG